MKIISGQYKGKNIKSLKDNSVRPTTNKIREAIFNIIEHNELITIADYRNLNYLEIFAGSAIMGFEFISRGVENCTLIDKNPELKKLFTHNAQILHDQKTNFIVSDINKLPQATQQFNLCFIDPPYKLKIEQITLDKLAQHNWLANNALVILETDKRNELIISKKFQTLFTKIYGKTKILFLNYQS